MIASSQAPQLDHDALLNDFIAGRGTLMELAADHGITLLDLIAWYEDDVTQDLLKALESMAARRTAIIAQSYAPGALSTLSYMLDNPSLSLVERRRVATQILRQAPRANASVTRATAGTTFAPAEADPAIATPEASDQLNPGPKPEAAPTPIAGRRAEPREPIAHSAHSRPPLRDRSPQAEPPEAPSHESQASPLPDPQSDAG